MKLDSKLLAQYAEFAVRIGVNPQPGQTLIIRAPIEGAHFVRCCAAVAYGLGVREVVVHYSDEKLSRIRLEYTEIDVLEDIKPWELRRYMDYAESEGGACVLSVIARDPEIYKGLDSTKVDRFTAAGMRAMKPWRELTMTDKIQWCVVAIPSPVWAAKVFPTAKPEQAEEKLWKAIFDVCRVTDGNVVAAWQAHVAQMNAWRDRMNALELDSLHLTSRNGTNLSIGLAEDAVWEGAQSKTPAGVPFIANIPTEEVFTAPHRLRTNGVARATKPYVYNGNLIEDFMVTFKDGAVIAYDARVGKDILGQLLNTDEGARHIGEIALVPTTSPINRSGLLFYNTLFDENAACHIAFGAGYPGTVQGGTEMTVQALLEKGVNDSLVHEDIMIGAPDMNITGITKSGQTVAIFQNGNWAF